MIGQSVSLKYSEDTINFLSCVYVSGAVSGQQPLQRERKVTMEEKLRHALWGIFCGNSQPVRRYKKA